MYLLVLFLTSLKWSVAIFWKCNPNTVLSKYYSKDWEPLQWNSCKETAASHELQKSFQSSVSRHSNNSSASLHLLQGNILASLNHYVTKRCSLFKIAKPSHIQDLVSSSFIQVMFWSLDSKKKEHGITLWFSLKSNVAAFIETKPKVCWPIYMKVNSLLP